MTTETNSIITGVDDFSGASGSADVGFIASGTGAVARTVQSKLRDIVSFADFGGSPSASAAANDAAFAAAFAVWGTDGGELFVPAGDYNVSVKVSPPFNASIRGAGSRATAIRQTTANTPCIELAQGNCRVQNIGLFYAVTPISGADAILVSGSDNQIDNVTIYNGYNGIKYTASGQKASNFTIKSCSNTGLFITGCADVSVSNFLITTATAADFANGGIRLENKAEAVLISNGSVLGGTYALVTGSAAFAEGNRPAYNNFTAVFFDSPSLGVFLNDIVATSFTACWFSGGRSGAGFPGMLLGQSDSNTFSQCRFFNCGSHGAVVEATAKRASFLGCLFADNSATGGTTNGRGLLIGANTTDFIITGCTATNGLYSVGNQGFGIVVSAGTSDRYIIADNLVSGNAVGGVFDGGTGVNKRVANNY